MRPSDVTARSNSFNSHPFTCNKTPKLEADKSAIEVSKTPKLEMPKPHKASTAFELHKTLLSPYARAFENFHRPAAAWLPHFPFYSPHGAQMPHHAAFPHFNASHLSANSAKDSEQTEALPLVVGSPKKKRTKVTDTRLSPRAARALLQEPVLAEQSVPQSPLVISPLNGRKELPLPSTPLHASLVPPSLPTSVAIPNPSLQHPDLFSLYASHKSNSDAFFGARSDLGAMAFLGQTRSSPVRDDSPNTSYTPSDSPSMFREPLNLGEDANDANLVSNTPPFHRSST